MQTIHTTSDEAGRALAAWLAPFIAAELHLDGLGRPASIVGGAKTVLEPARVEASYDADTCTTFMKGLGDKVLVNARTFFTSLADDGHVGSLQVASLIDVRSPRNIPSVLTTPLKRRAKSLALPRPWDETADRDNRTVWVSVGDIAGRMSKAADAELKRRREELV